MAASKNRKTSQFLSPENYIRQRVRLLPIKECLVNQEWEKSRMANILMALIIPHEIRITWIIIIEFTRHHVSRPVPCALSPALCALSPAL